MGAGDSRESPHGASSGLTADQLIARIRDVGAALLAIDADRYLIQWGGAAQRIFGFTPEEALGRRSDELGIVSLEDVQAMRKVLFRRPEKPVEQEMALCRKDGTTFPGWVRYALSFDRDGNVDGTTVFILDLTQAQRADVEIPTPTSFAPVVEIATMILTGTSREQLLERCVWLMATALEAELAGVFSPSLEGRGLRLEWGLGWDEGAVGPALELAANEEALLRSFEPQIIHPRQVPVDGLLDRHRVASGLIVPVGEPSHERGALAAFMRTPREFSEQEREFAKAIALMVSAAAEVARVRELEARFHRASRLEAMGQLTGGIAHDFNNLLAVVLNYASFAREDMRAGADAEESIAEIEKAARRAAELTRQLLVFSRQEAVALEPVDIAVAIDEARGLLGLTLGEQIALEIELEAGLGLVELGAGQLEQILVNLAVNARDAMEEGGTFRVAVKDAGGGAIGPGWIRLTVADDGAGMPPEVREKAFEPFFTTKPVGEGSGFGLATVFGIVSGAGGSIELRSELGKGTEIEMLLPVAEEAGSAPDGELEPNTSASERRVLLVEDDEMVRRLTARLLTRGGYDVVEANGPAEAIAAIRAELERGDGEPLALLLTDVVMPETSGVELALRVQQLVPGIKVVFMSGYTGDSVSREAVYEIEGGFVEKPFTPETLFESIERAFGRISTGRGG